jgi:hypothetical protein
MIYVWSSRMSLSVVGLREAETAARRLGIEFTAITVDDDARTLASLEVVYRGGTVHYPAALFYDRHRVLGYAIPGYKIGDTYRRLALERFAEGFPGAAGAGTVSLWIDQKASVDTLAVVPTPRYVGFYFKPVGATGLVSYASIEESFLFNLRSRVEYPIPGKVDPVATPDGKLLTRPGLYWHRVDRLVAGDARPLAADGDLPDEYQSVSIMKESAAARRYRVVTGWDMSIRYREYDARFGADSAIRSITPVSAPSTPCAERRFSLPISAKAGTDVSVLDVVTRTSKIVRVEPDGKCTDLMDLGFPAGKFAFSYDGSQVAFSTSRVDVDATGVVPRRTDLVYRDAFVLSRSSGRLVPLTHNRSLRALSFSEFLPDGSIILLDQVSRMRPDEAFRILRVK